MTRTVESFTIFCLVTLGGLAGSCSGVLPSAPDERLIDAADRGCDTDADCVLIDESCCPCTSNFDGGITAVAADAVAAIEERRAELCAEALCDSAISSSPTCCATEAVCRDARCEVFGVDGVRPGVGC